jgi:hypothetical protein
MVRGIAMAPADGTRDSLRSSRPAQLKRYLDAGFPVATMDYRLASETRIDGILEDVREGIAWVRRGRRWGRGAVRDGGPPGLDAAGDGRERRTDRVP